MHMKMTCNVTKHTASTTFLRARNSMRLVVFGGTGFVGTRVVKAALAAGLRVTAVSRSGKPSREDAELAGAEFVAADVLQGGERMERTLEGADAVISCVGAFGSQQFMRRANGDANVLIAESARAAGVGRMAYISVQPFRPVEALLRGYFEGKREAEAAVSAHFGAAGAILRPGVIFGSGRVPSLLGTPVGALLETAPLRHLALSLGPLGELLTPWLRVEDVALAAVAHVIAGAPVVIAGAPGPEAQAPATAAAMATATAPVTASVAAVQPAVAAAAAAYQGLLRLRRPAGEAVVLGWAEMEEASRRVRGATPPAVTLFWDGGCPLCRREIEHYKEIDLERNVEWVDIDADASRLAPHKVTRAQALGFMHAVDRHGALQVGVPAFLAIWEQLPRWWLLVPLVRHVPLAMPVLDRAYAAWAKHRLRITGRALGEGSACERST